MYVRCIILAMRILRRTQIFLTVEQQRRLRAWAKLQNKTASELIRAAIEDRYVRRPTPEEFQTLLDKSFGAWKGRKKSSTAMVRELRRGRRVKHLLA